MTRTAREYKENTKGGEEEKNRYLKCKSGRDFQQFTWKKLSQKFKIDEILTACVRYLQFALEL